MAPEVIPFIGKGFELFVADGALFLYVGVFGENMELYGVHGDESGVALTAEVFVDAVVFDDADVREAAQLRSEGDI